jgi:arsenate reductase
MAEAILRHLDPGLTIVSAGINPVDHISPVAIEVMNELGIKIEPSIPQHYKKYEHLTFDYLITVGDGTNEQLDVPPLHFKRKLHLGFHNPYKNFKTREELKDKCREIRDEIFNEMEYFYHNIIKKQKQQ